MIEILINIHEKKIFSCTINVPVLIGILFVCFIMIKLIPFAVKKSRIGTMKVNNLKIKVSAAEFDLKCDHRNREIAYKIWVELSTRKIGLPIDEENDVIVSVYDSWYRCFGIMRDLLKDVPAELFEESSAMIDMVIEILNEILRPHLTKWQAKFRHWYKMAISENTDKSPQEIQREYPDYNELIEDMKTVNTEIMHFVDSLKMVWQNDRNGRLYEKY